MMKSETVSECMLMNVEISDRCRHFGGILDPLDDEEFARIFAVLVDTDTGKQLELAGWNASVRRSFREEDDGPPSCALIVKIDYDICRPSVQVITDSREVSLDESKISCLDELEIDFANLTIVKGGLYNDRGKKIWTQAILKELKAYSLE